MALTPEEKIMKGNLVATIRDWVKGKLNDKADKSAAVSEVSYNSSTKKLTKTINGTTSDVVSIPLNVSDLTNDSGFITTAGTALSCSLPVSGWSNDQITVSCSGVTATSNVVVSPSPSSHTEYSECGIYCSAQGEGTLTFVRTDANTNALSVNVLKIA